MMLQQNYETIERRIALKLFKGIKQLDAPQPDLKYQNRNCLIEKWTSENMQLKEKLNHANHRLQALEQEIVRLKTIICRSYQKQQNSEQEPTTAHKSSKQKKHNKESVDQLGSFNFKSMPILKFDKEQIQDDLLSELYQCQQENSVTEQYSFSVIKNQKLESEYKKKQKNQSIYRTEPPKKVLNKNSHEDLKTKQFTLYKTKNIQKQKKQSQQKIKPLYQDRAGQIMIKKVQYKQIGVNTINEKLEIVNGKQTNQKMIAQFSKATAAQIQIQNKQTQNKLDSNQQKMLKQQIQQLRKIIMLTHHVHYRDIELIDHKSTGYQDKKFGILNQSSEQCCQQSYFIKVQHYKNQNLDLRKMILQLKYEIKQKQNQIQDHQRLLLKLKQSISDIKSQIYFQLLPCQYCALRSHINSTIQQDNDKFGVKNE